MKDCMRDKVVCDKAVCVCERDVCEKAVCERVVCDKAACDKAACEKDVCERLRVTKLCVRDKILFERDGLTCSGMSPSATPATQTKHRCHQAPGPPRLPRKPKVDATRRHACHAKCRGATGDQRRPSATGASPVSQALCLPRKTKADAAKPATQSAAPPRATSGDPVRHQSQRSVIGAMPATQNEGRCRQLPSLQRKVPRRHGRPAGTQRATRAKPVS